MAARIPQIEAEPYRVGQISPEASPAAFDDVGAGFRVLSHGLGDVATTAHQLERKRQSDDEYKWLVDAEGQFKDEAREWTSNPENNSREDFGPATIAHLKARQKEYLSKAPSQRARSRLQDILNSQIDSRGNAAINIGEATKIRNAQKGLDENIYKAMDAFRADAAVSPYYAEQNLEPTRQLLHESIDARWGDTSKAGPALHEIIDEQIIIGSAPSSPEYARKVLNGSKYIDEKKRSVLENHIESAEAGNTALQRVQVTTELTKRLNIGKVTGTTVDMPNKAVFSVYGKMADAEEYKYQQDVEAHNKSVKLVSNLRDKTAPYQDAALAKASGDPEAMLLAREQLKRNQKLQEQDPAAWVRQNNSNVFNAFQKAGTDPQSLGLAFDMALEYQGPAPAGVAPEDAAKYLNLPTHAQHILTVNEAEQRAGMIRQGSPDQQLQTLRQMEKEFPNKRHWAQVYNDMVTLPSRDKAVPAEMQLAFLIDNPTIQKQFMVAIGNTEGLKGLTEEKAKAFEDAMDRNPTWKSFKSAMMGDMLGAANSMQEYKTGIQKYAYALSFGRTAKEAVTLAVQHVIGDQMWPTTVNGQTLMIPRKREVLEIGQSLPDRTTEEIEDMGRRLAIELRTLDPREIQLVDEYGRPKFPRMPRLPEGSTGAQQYIRDAVTSRGFFVPEADGQSVTVYVSDEGGAAFQLRDKRGQPFELPLDAVPTYSKTAPSFMSGSVTVKEQPQKTYDLMEPIYPGAWGTGSKRLNWPRNDNFFRQLQKPPYRLEPGAVRGTAITP